METLIISFFVIVTAELGDKTQLIALCLASRFRKPIPVILGILAATLANHIASGLVGHWLGAWLSGTILHWLLAFSFFGAAIWALKPDEIDENITCETGNRSIIVATFITFFMAEMGDKTQLATVALAAQFPALVWVVVGTTLGMMAANIPAVLLSHAIAGKVSLKIVRATSGIIFAGLGIYELRQLWQQ